MIYTPVNAGNFVESSRSYAAPFYTGSNSLTNSFLNTTNDYADTVETWNGTVVLTNGFDNPYFFCSPIFTNTNNYKSLGPKYYLNTRRPYYDLGYNHPIQKRIVKMTSIGSTLIGFNSLNRSFPDIPVKSITNTASGPTTSSTDWAKYEIYQGVNIPGGSTNINFGCGVRVPKDDEFRSRNFGGIYLFSYSSSLNKYYVNFVAICGSAVPSLLGGTSSYTNYQEGTSNSLFMWGGYSQSGPPERWHSNLDLKKIEQSYLTTRNYDAWQLLNYTIPVPPSTTAVCLAMYFAENHTYLNNDGVRGGSISFYNPYINFS